MIKLYEIQYKYEDELSEKGWRNSIFVAYDAGTSVEGATLQRALDCANGDYSGVDKVLEKYGTKDDEVMFYFDNTGVADESLVLKLQHDFDIIINDIQEIHL